MTWKNKIKVGLYILVPINTLLILTLFYTLIGLVYQSAKQAVTLEDLQTHSPACNTITGLQKAQRSLVTITSSNLQGNGIALTTDGFIITTFHLVNYQPDARVILQTGESFSFKIYAVDPELDTAIIKIESQINAIYADGYYQTTAGEDVYLLGSNEIRKGILTRKSTLNTAFGNTDYLETDAVLPDNSSGGALINNCGTLIGLITSTLGNGFESTLAISSRHINYAPIYNTAQWTDEMIALLRQSYIPPNDSPQNAVTAFYAYQTAGQWEQAFSIKRSGADSTTAEFEQWRSGYLTTLNVTVYSILTDPTNSRRVQIKFSSTDIKGSEFQRRYFEGYWETIETDAGYLLDRADISEVINPTTNWFNN